MPATPRRPEKPRERPERAGKDDGERLYFGRQGLRLVASIFVFFGVVVLAATPFVIGRFRLLLIVLIATFGVANLVMARGLWKLTSWVRQVYVAWAVAAVVLHVIYQLTRPFLAWGIFAVTEVVFVFILFQIGRYLDHDVSRLRTNRSGKSAAPGETA